MESNSIELISVNIKKKFDDLKMFFKKTFEVNHKAEIKELTDKIDHLTNESIRKEEEFTTKLNELKSKNDSLKCEIERKDSEEKSRRVEFQKEIDNLNETNTRHIEELEQEISRLRNSAKKKTAITNGNIHNNKTIEITCSEKCCGSFENIVNFSDMNSNIHVNGSPSPRWLKFDFKNRQIQMNAYLINTGYYNQGVSNKSPKSWKVEISNDDSNWETVDEQNDVSEIKENNKIKLFEVKPTAPFRYMRIITDKDNHYNSDGFVIGNLEIYGWITES